MSTATPADFAKCGALIQFGCGWDFEPLSLQAARNVVAADGRANAVGFGTVMHPSHEHFVLLQIEEWSRGVWRLLADAHAEVAAAPGDTAIVLDLGSHGTFSVGLRAQGTDGVVRLRLGDAQDEAELVERFALLVVRVPNERRGPPTLEMVDRRSGAVRSLVVDSGLTADSGSSRRATHDGAE